MVDANSSRNIMNISGLVPVTSPQLAMDVCLPRQTRFSLVILTTASSKQPVITIRYGEGLESGLVNLLRSGHLLCFDAISCEEIPVLSQPPKIEVLIAASSKMSLSGDAPLTTLIFYATKPVRVPAHRHDDTITSSDI